MMFGRWQPLTTSHCDNICLSLLHAVMVGIYIIMATGIWFHELENLAVDGEDLIRNGTLPDLMM